MRILGEERSGGPGRWRGPVGRLRIAGFAEGTTLLVLVGVAVPLKHLAGMPTAVSMLGPLHGLAFIAYFVAAMEVVGAGELARRDAWRTALVALVPFGTFANDRFLARLQARATGGSAPPPGAGA